MTPPSSASPDWRRPLALYLGLVAPAALLLVSMIGAAGLTIDDAYISYRYAKNLLDGHGLVYNPGERIEGYTNFLWTLLVVAGMAIHLPPDLTTKLLGGAAALGSLAIVWRFSIRLEPTRRLPPLAPWLLASSAPFAGYAVMGLETIFFVFLVLLATWRLNEEEEEARTRFPWSGVVFGLAALTRPEGPLYFVLALLLLAWPLPSRRNLTRAATFLAIFGLYLIWRRFYYGHWLPNTFQAKTGNLAAQLEAGGRYLTRYLAQAGAVTGFALFGGAVMVGRRNRLGILAAVFALAVSGYVALVGGDWMPIWRFLTPVEPMLFLLADVGFRAALEGTGPPSSFEGPRTFRLGAVGGMILLAFSIIGSRADALGAQKKILANEKQGWDRSVHPLAEWLIRNDRPGTLALGDIGYLGWKTGYPILDILGLVDPVIAELPGGYAGKQGPLYLDYFFRRMPEYFVLISNRNDCHHPFHASIEAVYHDPQERFRSSYRLFHAVPTGGGIRWCIYGTAAAFDPVRRRPLFDFEAGFSGWEVQGNAFEAGPTGFAMPGQQPVMGGEGARLANSFHPTLRDAATGTLTSPAFEIDRKRLGLLVAGGGTEKTRVELLVDGRAVRSATGQESEDLAYTIWDLREHAGRRAQLRLVDEETGAWGHILVDEVALFD